MTHPGSAVAEGVARASYGRLLAILVAQGRDIALAEDALASAFEAALRTWPQSGVPDRPEAWLITVARNQMGKDWRHRAVMHAAWDDILRRAGERAESRQVPDDRLYMLFLCAHPALDPTIRTPLMLQTVMGLDARRIARAFVVDTATMAQRLVRAKARIRDAGLRFVLTDVECASDRLGHVSDAIYAAFGTGWDNGDDSDGLAAEAIFLARALCDLMPSEPEPKGLLALMLYVQARAGARRSPDGAFVPLDRQDARLWDRTAIIAAEGLLTAAARQGRFGRYQCEAAIQSVHCQRPITGRTNHAALAVLYGLLQAHAPSIGATVGLAAVMIETGDIRQARQLLDDVPDRHRSTYQPYWAMRLHLAWAMGDAAAAQAALEQALRLTSDPALADHLRKVAAVPVDVSHPLRLRGAATDPHWP